MDVKLCTTDIRPVLLGLQALVPISFASLLLPSVCGLQAGHVGQQRSVSAIWNGLSNGRFLAFQLTAWVLWTLSVVLVRPGPQELTGPGSLRQQWAEDEPSVVTGAATTAGFMSQVLMLKSFLVYYRVRGSASKARSGWASALSVFLALLLALLACALVYELEHVSSNRDRLLLALLAVAALLTSAASTHGLGGFLRHGGAPHPPRTSQRAAGDQPLQQPHDQAHQKQLSGDIAACGVNEAGEETIARRVYAYRVRPRWKFFQPFQGGALFIATQVAGWLLFSTAVVGLAWGVRATVQGAVLCVRCWMHWVGASMMGAQAFLALSLYTFHTSPAELIGAAKARLAVHAPILMLFLPAHVVCAGIALLFTAASWSTCWVLLAASLAAYYMLTGRGNPHVTGSRYWPTFHALMADILPSSLDAWLGGVTVVQYPSGEGDASTRHTDRRGRLTQHDVQNSEMLQAQKLSSGNGGTGLSSRVRVLPLSAYLTQPASGQGGEGGEAHGVPRGEACGRMVYGYHPHGLYPAGAIYLPLLPAFQRLLPSPQYRPVTLTANVLHMVPILRDLAQWVGSRCVSRSSVLHALTTHGSVLLVPGGQEELVHQWRVLHRGGENSPKKQPRQGIAQQGSGEGVEPSGTNSERGLDPGVGFGALTDNGRLGSILRTLMNLVWGLYRGLGRQLSSGLADVQAPTGMDGAGGASGQEVPAQELVLCTRHRGFVRLAVRTGAALVPILVLGEIFQLRNLVNMPNLQTATYRTLGFPVPYLLTGRWGITPLPSPGAVTAVVGPAIFLSQPSTVAQVGQGGKCCKDEEGVAAEPCSSSGSGQGGLGAVGQDWEAAAVEEVHKVYYLTLRDMYEQHAKQHPRYQNVRLVLKDFSYT